MKYVLSILLGAILLLVTIFCIYDYKYPLIIPEIEVSPVVLDRNGEVLRHFATKEGVFRQWIELEDVNEAYLSTLIQYEDRYFRYHYGINPLSTVRAAFQWILSGHVVSGSSTLTMQVARLLYPHDRTIAGKITQMFRAIQLENQFTKDEILTLYINLTPMGGNLEGVEAASWRYFSKHARSLTISESALLVALPQRPSAYRPDLYPQNALNARNKVLKRLRTYNTLSEEAFNRYQKDPLGLDYATTLNHAPLISEKLIKQFPKQHTIKTTIDKPLQTSLEKFLERTSHQWPQKVSGAILVVNNYTHEIHAYLGSTDLFNQDRFGYIDMVTAIRSPGSTLKPFAYGMAMDYGIIHEASLLTDVKRNFEGYVPKNFDHQYRGRVNVADALRTSLNIPIVQVLTHLTPHRFIKTLRDAKIEILVRDPNLSVILGGVGINLYEQVRLFSSLSTKGTAYPLKIVSDDNDQEGASILSEASSWIIHNILNQMNPSHRINHRKIAWKTGTSYGYRDAWAIGTSKAWTVGVWIGRPDSVPNVGTLANQFATPLLFDVFNFLPKERDVILPKPESVTEAMICWPSGRRIESVPIESCEQTYLINTINGQVPPTLYDAPGEMPHEGWPILLTDTAPLTQQVKILTLQDESILFSSPYTIKLEALGNAPFLWYLNGKLLESPELDMETLTEGIYTLTVQDTYHKSDSITFEVKDE